SRGLHILFALAHEQLICFGPRHGKQPTFVMLEEWLPPRRGSLTREESLGQLAGRYLRGHGPAGPADLAWWAGLTPKEAKEALAIAGAPEIPAARTRRVHLLPAFDEYTVAYRDRSAVVDAAFAKKVNAGGGMINAIVVIDGLVAGTWKRTFHGPSVDVKVTAFRALTERERRGVDSAIARYTRFLGR
ncbi:MAG TPA: crosslink repair DNA glycosylase YcaQ family protein, partial [Thermoanaerobaculia bacterium]|nr:crosslink repair DNA glycosylase YcaQ family protein [Thermoanaerobaculia bacterium]